MENEKSHCKMENRFFKAGKWKMPVLWPENGSSFLLGYSKVRSVIFKTRGSIKFRFPSVTAPTVFGVKSPTVQNP